MRPYLPILAALAACPLAMAVPVAEPADSGPDTDRAAAYTHRYHNLFVELLGHTPGETRARIAQAFQQLFHGDGKEQRLYFETGANANGPLAYITDWANNDARTEGMSYGMMIAVQLDRKREFDALWNWSRRIAGAMAGESTTIRRRPTGSCAACAITLC